MSDLFDNLVKRSAGPAETLRPKLPSMFESPAAAASAPPGDLLVEDREQEAPTPRAFEKRRNEPKWEDVTPWVDELRPPVKTERLVEPTTARVPTPQVARPVIAAPEPPEPVQATKNRENEPEEVRRARQPKSAQPVAEQPESPVIRQPARRDQPLEETFRRPARAEMPAAKPRIREDSQELTPQAPLESRRHREPPEPPRLIEPRLTPRAEARRTVAAQARRFEEPTIHVTIGRVEVRATLPASEPTKERRAPAVMPLEEYLRSRRSRDAV
jgi:hypothetical protein